MAGRVYYLLLRVCIVKTGFSGYWHPVGMTFFFFFPFSFFARRLVCLFGSLGAMHL